MREASFCYNRSMNNSEFEVKDVIVQHRSGPFRWNKVTVGLLRWTKEGRVQLFFQNPATNDLSAQPEFDVTPQEITRVSGSLSYLYFYIRDKVYRLNIYFGPVQDHILATPADRILTEFDKNKASDAELWANLLRGAGVKVHYRNVRNFLIFSVTLGLLIVLLAGLAVYFIKA